MANLLMSQIENMINSSILNFNTKVAKKYNIDISELNELWANGGEGASDSDTQPIESPLPLSKSKSFSQAKPTQPQVTLTKSQTISTPPPKKASPSQEKTCPYSFSRGPNSGSVCGTKIKGEGNFCSKHKQYENKEQKGSKKVFPQPKKSPASSVASDNEDEEEQRIREELNKKRTEGFSEKEISYMFFKKPELGENLSFHKQTGFVCNEKKLIVGKKTNDNKIIPLTDEDIKVAKSWNFTIKKNEEENKGERKVENETKVESKVDPPTTKIVKIVKPPVITKGSVESKAQESKAQEIKKTPAPKKFNIPIAKLTTTKIEKSTLQVKETPAPEVITEKKSNQSLNEEAKNTKKTISNIIEQQKDLEDILEDLTKGDDEEEDNGSIKGSDDEDEDCADDLQEEDEIFEDE